LFCRARHLSLAKTFSRTGQTMELWNDFEGKAVDGRFQLDHLIGPKGRSAYFTTRDETGAPAVIRLIESLNDEQEILARWRTVTGLKQEHLVEVLACGQTVIDGTHLVYAVMEPTDAELADVLRDRALTPDETRQVALDVADGLETLHAKGLVHQHIDAEHVLAKGETVKLRGDVVREAPEGTEGAALRAKDVRDLSLLLSYALTRNRHFGEVRLPVPFEEVVRKGESGAWGLQAMSAALRPIPTASRPAPSASSAAKPTVAPVRPGTASATRPAPPAGPVAPQVAPASTPTQSTEAHSAALPMAAASAAAANQGASQSARSTAPAAVASRLANQTAGQGEGLAAHLRSPRAPDRIMIEPAAEPKRTGLLLAIGAGFLLLVLLGIYFFRSSRANQSRPVAQDAPAAATVPQQSTDNRPAAKDGANTPTPTREERPSAATEPARAGGLNPEVHTPAGAGAPSPAAQWRVVAFTYNHEQQAAQKVHAIAAKHPNLKPEVYSARGRAPYLVTFGGWMTREQAASVRSRARSEGLPRDVYAQNYREKNR